MKEGKRVRGWIPRACVQKEGLTQLNKVPPATKPVSSTGKKNEQEEVKEKGGQPKSQEETSHTEDPEQPTSRQRRKRNKK